MNSGLRSVIARWRGLIGVVGRRVFVRAVRTAPQRTGLAVAAVATAIALMLLVTGVSLGLATQSTVYGDSTDYWIVPDSGTTLTTVLTVDDPQLANVHTTSARIDQFDGADASTPVLIELVRMRAPQSDGPEYVLAIGVVPDGGSTSISGVSTPALESGDPYYAGGSYDGEFTGEVVLSPAAADILNASSDDSLTVESQATGERVTFAVAAVSESRIRTVGGQVPVALVHLSELQSLTGANEDDLADQILVSTDSPGVKPALERVYPEAAVVERTGLAAQRLGDENLLLAMSVTALVVALAVGVLFVMTTTALEIEADRQQLAVFAVLGFSTRARSIVVVVTTLLIALSGAAVGVLVAAVGSWGINVALTALFASIPIVVFHPLFIVYALCVALVIGMLAVPYPLLLARRTDVLGELT